MSDDKSPWLTIPMFVAHINGVYKPWTVARMAKAGLLKSMMPAGKRLIHRDALDLYYAEHVAGQE